MTTIQCQTLNEPIRLSSAPPGRYSGRRRLAATAGPALSRPVAEPACYFSENVGSAGGKNKDFGLRDGPPAAARDHPQAPETAGFAASNRRN